MPDKKILDKIINAILQVIIPDKIILFGSQARGEAKHDSDYDILVIKSGVEHRRKTAQEIHKKLVGTSTNVDIIIETPERLEKYKDIADYIYKSILDEGIVIYG
ncbi:MAG: DNA polymerase beta protein [uncultured bacterium]|nr:MAG: DNA polymerase beta protein [uncultured bacterium]HBH18396.1 DNA polymerase beta [Cyanobacteria bacterium UBA9579]